jgi:hypothetical protein
MVVSKFLEGLIEKPEGFLAGKPELAGFDGKLGGQRFEAANLLRAEQPRRLLIHVATTAGHSAENAFALEILKGPGDGVGIHAEFGGELADGGKRVVVAERAGGDGMAHLVLDLEVDGNAGGGMDTEEHRFIDSEGVLTPSPVLIQ